jgi:hypothetical protein
MSPLPLFVLLSLAADGDLKAAARAVVKTTGCTQVSQCQVMPVGSRPCGGPSEFLVYCAKSTDEKKLKAKVKAATDAEKALNATDGLMGTCQVLSSPTVKLVKGACVAEEPKSADVPM